MATGSGVKDTVHTMRTFLLFLMGLWLAAAAVFAITDEISLDLLVAAAGAAVGLWFAITAASALAAPGLAAGGRLQTLMYVFGGAMVLSWIIAYVDKEFLDAIELLGVAIAILAIFLMLSIVAEVRRLAGS